MTTEKGQWAVIILAAGRSSRMGRAKQLVVVDGERMVRHAVTTGLASGAAEVVLVLGAYGDEVSAAVVDLAQRSLGRLHLVNNPDWETGQAGSMQAGLQGVSDACGAVIFLPVDQPYMEPLLL